MFILTMAYINFCLGNGVTEMKDIVFSVHLRFPRCTKTVKQGRARDTKLARERVHDTPKKVFFCEKIDCVTTPRGADIDLLFLLLTFRIQRTNLDLIFFHTLTSS